MKKNFDCLEMKWQIQDELWKEAGESLSGLKKLLFDKKKNVLYQDFINKIAAEKRIFAE